MTYNIFFSYSTANLATARKICNYFKQIPNTEVFLCEDTVTVGQLTSDITARINSCDMFIVLYDKSSHTSQYVQNEIGVATGANKPIIPLVLESQYLPTAMLTGKRYYPIWDGENWEVKLLELYGYLEQKANERNIADAVLVIGAILALGILLFGGRNSKNLGSILDSYYIFQV